MELHRKVDEELLLQPLDKHTEEKVLCSNTDDVGQDANERMKNNCKKYVFKDRDEAQVLMTCQIFFMK